MATIRSSAASRLRRNTADSFDPVTQSTPERAPRPIAPFKNGTLAVSAVPAPPLRRKGSLQKLKDTVKNTVRRSSDRPGTAERTTEYYGFHPATLEALEAASKGTPAASAGTPAAPAGAPPLRPRRSSLKGVTDTLKRSLMPKKKPEYGTFKAAPTPMVHALDSAETLVEHARTPSTDSDRASTIRPGPSPTRAPVPAAFGPSRRPSHKRPRLPNANADDHLSDIMSVGSEEAKSVRSEEVRSVRSDAVKSVRGEAVRSVRSIGISAALMNAGSVLREQAQADDRDGADSVVRSERSEHCEMLMNAVFTLHQQADDRDGAESVVSRGSSNVLPPSVASLDSISAVLMGAGSMLLEQVQADDRDGTGSVVSRSSSNVLPTSEHGGPRKHTLGVRPISRQELAERRSTLTVSSQRSASLRLKGDGSVRGSGAADVATTAAAEPRDRLRPRLDRSSSSRTGLKPKASRDSETSAASSSRVAARTQLSSAAPALDARRRKSKAAAQDSAATWSGGQVPEVIRESGSTRSKASKASVRRSRTPEVPSKDSASASADERNAIATHEEMLEFRSARQSLSSSTVSSAASSQRTYRTARSNTTASVHRKPQARTSAQAAFAQDDAQSTISRASTAAASIDALVQELKNVEFPMPPQSDTAGPQHELLKTLQAVMLAYGLTADPDHVQKEYNKHLQPEMQRAAQVALAATLCAIGAQIVKHEA